MNDGKTITALIVKLNKLTKREEISWNSNTTRFSLDGNEEIVDKVYRTKYKGKYFRLFKYRSRFYTDEDEYHWIKSWRLELVDNNFNSEWTFPEEGAIRDLYESVRFQCADVKSLFEDLLEDEE